MFIPNVSRLLAIAASSVFFYACSGGSTMNEADKARKELAMAGIEITKANYQKFLEDDNEKILTLFEAVGFAEDKYFGANLAWACAMGYTEIVQHEIQRGAELDEVLDWTSPMTPLMLACLHDNEKVAEVLLSAGADPNVRIKLYNESGEIEAVESAMHYARRTGDERLIELLHSYGWQRQQDDLRQ